MLDDVKDKNCSVAFVVQCPNDVISIKVSGKC